jgi:hypothetical protein
VTEDRAGKREVHGTEASNRGASRGSSSKKKVYKEQALKKKNSPYIYLKGKISLISQIARILDAWWLKARLGPSGVLRAGKFSLLLLCVVYRRGMSLYLYMGIIKRAGDSDVVRELHIALIREG